MLPMVELTIFALGILLIDLWVPRESKWINAVGAFVGVLFAAVCVWQIQSTLPRGAAGFYNSLLVDRFAIYFWYLFLAGAAIAILMSVRYLDVEDEHHGEYYALLLLSVVGMMCMAAGIDIVLLFIGLELMAISTYVLVGFLRRDRRSNEAALKYLLLGAFSSGIFAYGLSLLYGLTGSTSLGEISRGLARLLAKDPHNPVAIVALLTTITGLLFKVAAVPFHQWAPDAYEGAPTSITGFMSVAVKAAGWAMLLRILLWGLLPMRSVWVPLIVFVAIATMTGANFAARTHGSCAHAHLLAFAGWHSSAGRLLGKVLHLPESDRNRPLRVGVAGRAVFRLRTLLLSKNCQRRVHGEGGRKRAAASEPRHARCAGPQRPGYAQHRGHARTIHSAGELVVGFGAKSRGGAIRPLGELAPTTAQPNRYNGLAGFS